jgi:hypothetical protein
MTYQGKVKGGAIVLERDTKLPEGALVQVELLPGEGFPPEPTDDPLFEMTSLAVDTGIPDLATNIDHYLYGHPKTGDA